MSISFCSCTPATALINRCIQECSTTDYAQVTARFPGIVRMRSSIQHPTTPFSIAFLPESVFVFVSMHRYVDSSHLSPS
jgi:hypothetical protein